MVLPGFTPVTPKKAQNPTLQNVDSPVLVGSEVPRFPAPLGLVCGWVKLPMKLPQPIPSSYTNSFLGTIWVIARPSSLAHLLNKNTFLQAAQLAN